MFVDSLNAAALAAGTKDGQAKQSISGVTEDGKTMAQVLADVLQAAAAADENKVMSISEYRSCIYDKISQIPFDPSQALASVSVHITDEGLAAMRDDPEYEKWVLDELKTNFAFKDPWTQVCGGSYHVHWFGATKEEYKGQSWFPGYAGGHGGEVHEMKSAGCMWRRDTPKILSQDAAGIDRLEFADSAADEKKDVYAQLRQKLRLERMLDKMALERKDFQSALLEQASLHRRAVQEMNQTGRPSVEAASPVPQFHGVPAAFLLGMLGGMGGM